MSRVKPKAKIGLVVIALIAVFFGLRTAAEHGWIPTRGIMKALVPPKAVLLDVKDAQVADVAPAPLPLDSISKVQATQIRGAIWEWNAQAGLILANGGAQTTKGSLMEKRGVKLTLYRQDATDDMIKDLVACAGELAGGGSQCSKGANFAVIMGDGAGQFAAAVNPQLAKLGAAYKVKVPGAVGYSRNEDAFMAPPTVKQDPQNAKGLLIEGVLRDGDWNIALKWAGDNNIKNNPDEHTYDADAMNWVNAQDYNTAASDYVAGKCDDRKVVKDGHLTGETKHVCVNAIVTWTPGDVTAVTQKGGLVKVVSSKQYRSQMPAVIIGSGKFFADNRPEIEGLLAAAFEGGDQIKAYDKALHKASDISAKLYGDQNGAYWYKYFKGVTQKDSQGLEVELGGSAVCNLADNLILFGLMPSTNDNFRSTYTIFSNIVAQQYPDIVKATPIPAISEVEDKSYVTGAQALLSDTNEVGAVADVPTYGTAGNDVISKRSYAINFRTGSADLTASGEQQLRDLKDNLAITSLYIKVDGYTDNTGDEQTINLPLSEARASAVRAFLQRTAPGTFPSKRFSSVDGHGSANPVASNSTADGRSSNRRVEITLIGN